MNGGGSGTIRITVAQVEIDSPAGRIIALGSPGGGVNQTATERQFPIEGIPAGSSGAQVLWRTFCIFPFTASKYFARVITNGRNQSHTLAFHLNGVDSALQVSIPALTTGVFEDTVSTVDVSNVFSDVFNHRLSSPALDAQPFQTGSIGFLQAELVAPPAVGRAFFFWF